MGFYADLHIHSKYSRATARDCDLEHLALWACRKGIRVVGTGDFTHPAWLAEIDEKLVPAEPGLLRLAPEVEREVGRRLPPALAASTRFMLQVEISTIYKKGERTRKVHHVIYVPDREAAHRLSARLARVGNIASDGRPILGLDSRDLLEMVLECSSEAFLVPAHIWTPWFAVLGSKSGFDSIEECYGDLAGHIFALETGLSSDPEMNWRLSALDHYRLVSNSDAHSPARLGREACVFETEPSFHAMRRALETGEGYGGTVEMFPEEGKYHLDGHRKCRVCLSPAETRERRGACPTCGKPVTVGVMHRVEALADREQGSRPPGAAGYRSLVPLAEVLGEVLRVGAGSKTVGRAYEGLLGRLGPELRILEELPLEELRRAAPPLLAEAVERLRRGSVRRVAGYDGEYGVIRLFEDGELEEKAAVGTLFRRVHDRSTTSRRTAAGPDAPVPETARPAGREQRSSAGPGPGTATLAGARPRGRGRDTPDSAPASADAVTGGSPLSAGEEADAATGESPLAARGVDAAAGDPPSPGPRAADGPGGSPPSLLDELDPDQRAAATAPEGPLLIIAGPGTGKTRTLTHRIAYLIERGLEPRRCLAVTFTRRAAAEMRERLEALAGARARDVTVTTFHALGLRLLREHAAPAGLPGGFAVLDDAARAAILTEELGVPASRAGRRLAEISRCKRTRSRPSHELAPLAEGYERALRRRNGVDFDDLLLRPVELLEASPELRGALRERLDFVAVDEVQDIDPLQYELIRQLVPAGGNLCAIGDPDQSIYSFRGADARSLLRFEQDFPSARVLQLSRNYRSAPAIVEAAVQVIAPSSLVEDRALDALRVSDHKITIQEAPTDRAEAELVVRTIEQLVGGHSFFSIDSERSSGGSAAELSFSDFAVLYRTEAQAKLLCEALERSGMPFARHGHERLRDRAEIQALTQRLGATPAGVPIRDRLAQAAATLERAERAAATAALEALEPLAAEAGSDLDRFLDALALSTGADLFDPRAERISLLTLHASKGLEFEVVFITGCEEGVLPLAWGSRAESLEEERRLLFVGLTRARERLYLCYARRRWWRGRQREMELSSLVRDIEKELLQRARRDAGKRRVRRDQLELFRDQ